MQLYFRWLPVVDFVFGGVRVGASVVGQLGGVRVHLGRILSTSLFGISRTTFSRLRSRMDYFRRSLGRLLRFRKRRLRFSRLGGVDSVRGGVGRIGGKGIFFSPRLREDVVFPGERSRRRSSFTLWVFACKSTCVVWGECKTGKLTPDL